MLNRRNELINKFKAGNITDVEGLELKGLVDLDNIGEDRRGLADYLNGLSE